MSNYYINPNDPDSLTHFGIRGMKWGERNYQNPDGSLTPAGRERYGVGDGRRHASLADNIHQYKVKKKRSKALEKARKTKAKNAAEKKKQAKKDEKRKAKMKKNYVRDDARKTYQNLDNMSDDEVKAAMARLNNESKIREYAMAEIDQEKKANPSKYEKALDYINKAVTISKNVSDIANNISNTKSYMDKMFGNSSGNNNNQSNNQNQNNQNNGGGKKKKNKDRSNNQQNKSIESKISDSIQNKQEDKLRDQLVRNQAGLDARDQMLRDNRAARGAAQAYQNWFNSNYTASTRSSITPDTFSTSLTNAFSLDQINHGKDILVAMGLD